MTTLGKVFTGLIFFLSILFFTLSVGVNASHVDRKTEAAEFDAQARESQTKNGELDKLLTDTKAELEIEQESRRNALAALQIQLDARQAELEAMERALSQAQGEHSNQVRDLQNTQQDLSSQTQQNEQLRDQVETAKNKRDELFQQLVTAKDEFNKLQGSLQALQARQQQLANGS